MKLHKLSHARELLRAADELSLNAGLLSEEEGCKYVASVLEKFRPWKVEGHLSIGGNSEKMHTDSNEFIFSSKMKAVRGFIFFEQNYKNKCQVVVVDDARSISKIMENSYGMEYFISDSEMSFLISVNWYSIECVGAISFV